MEAKLYVGNLSYDTTEDDLKGLFEQSGTVTSVALIKDRISGTSKGFAFVTMSTISELQKAITMFNNFSLRDRQIKVSPARPPEDSGRSGFGRNGPGGPGKHNDRRGGGKRY